MMAWVIPDGRSIEWEAVTDTRHGVVAVRIYDDGTTDSALDKTDNVERSHLLKLPKQPKKKGCCGGVPIVRWMFIRWHGVPYPVRIWRWWLSRTWKAEPGCGCIVKLKACWTATRMIYGQTIRAARFVWKA